MRPNPRLALLVGVGVAARPQPRDRAAPVGVRPGQPDRAAPAPAHRRAGAADHRRASGSSIRTSTSGTTSERSRDRAQARLRDAPRLRHRDALGARSTPPARCGRRCSSRASTWTGRPRRWCMKVTTPSPTARARSSCSASCSTSSATPTAGRCRRAGPRGHGARPTSSGRRSPVDPGRGARRRGTAWAWRPGVAGAVRDPRGTVGGARAGRLHATGLGTAPHRPRRSCSGVASVAVSTRPASRSTTCATRPGTAGGSVNDAYIAAVCGALRLYHEHLGAPVDDAAAGHADQPPHRRGRRRRQPLRRRPVRGADRPDRPDRADAPGPRDRTGRQRTSLRWTPSAWWRPSSATCRPRCSATFASTAAGTDIQASNVRGYPSPPFVAGAEITETYWFGPLPGVAMMVVLMSQAGTCFVGVHSDTAVGHRRRRCSAVASKRASPRCSPVDRGDEPVSDTLRLPGRSPRSRPARKGRSIGAFFDFDGTLIAGYSALHLSRSEVPEAGRGLRASWPARSAVRCSGRLGRAGFADVLQIGADAWKGREDEDLERWGAALRGEDRRPHLSRDPRARAGPPRPGPHRRAVLVGDGVPGRAGGAVPRRSSRCSATATARRTASSPARSSSRSSGARRRPSAVQALRRRPRRRPDRSYFYADGDEDIALMHLVGHPRPTNPGKRMAKGRGGRGLADVAVHEPVARGAPGRSSWPARPPSSRSQRAGRWSALVRRDRRAAVNFSSPRWLSALLGDQRREGRGHGRRAPGRGPSGGLRVQPPEPGDGLIAAPLVERDFASDRHRRGRGTTRSCGPSDGSPTSPSSTATTVRPTRWSRSRRWRPRAFDPRRCRRRPHRHDDRRAVRRSTLPRRPRGRAPRRAHRHPQRRARSPAATRRRWCRGSSTSRS